MQTDLATFDQKISESTQQLQEINDSHENLVKTWKNLNAELKDVQSRIPDLQRELDMGQRKISENRLQEREVSAQIQKLQRERSETDFNLKVEDLMSKQKTFFEMLEQRMQFHHDQIAGDFVGFGDMADPAQVCKTLRLELEGKMNFSHFRVFVTGFENRYAEWLRDICEKSIRKETVTASMKMNGQEIIDRLLFHHDFEQRWK